MTYEAIELSSSNEEKLIDGACEKGSYYSALDDHPKPNVNNNDVEEKTPVDEGDTLTDVQGFMLLMRSYLGTAFVGIPYTVKLLGLWSGTAGLFFGGLFKEFGALVLIRNAQILTERTGERFSDIGILAERSMEHGPSCLQSHARKFKGTVNCCILLTCGLMMPDMISIMNLLARDVLRHCVEVSNTLSIIGVSVLLLPVYITRRMKLLSYLATAGNVVLLLVIIISFQYICNDLPDTRTRPASKHIDFLIMTSFVNDVMFSFGGVVTLLPIRNKMKSTKNFDGWDGLLGLTLAILLSSYVGCGFFGYLKFGDETKANFILNLPSNNWVYESLKALCFLSMYCTMGMFVFVAVDIIWSDLKERIHIKIIQTHGEFICSVLLLIFACIFTILVPEFELLMSLTGCVGSYFLSVIVPFSSTILVLHGEKDPKSTIGKLFRKLTISICFVIIALGIYSMISGLTVALYTTINHIVL